MIKWTILYLQPSVLQKILLKEIKRHPYSEIICIIHASDKELLIRIHCHLLQSNKKEYNISLVIKEMQIDSAMTYLYVPTRMAKMKQTMPNLIRNRSPR